MDATETHLFVTETWQTGPQVKGGPPLTIVGWNALIKLDKRIMDHGMMPVDVEASAFEHDGVCEYRLKVRCVPGRPLSLYHWLNENPPRWVPFNPRGLPSHTCEVNGWIPGTTAVA
jgi:hypothetical protein